MPNSVQLSVIMQVGRLISCFGGICKCVCCSLTQYREGYPKQEHGHASQHRYEEVTAQKNGQYSDRRVVSTETANGSLVLSCPDKTQEQQCDNHRPDKQLEGLEIPERKETFTNIQ